MECSMRSNQKATETKAAAETPYLAARREWNERYGDYISRANNWRLLALGCVATSVILASGMVWLSGQQKVVPYIVETNGYGEIIRVARANTPDKPSEKHIKATLRQWITGARTVYVDARAQQQIVATTYATTLPDSPAYTTISSYHREINPYQRAKQETVEVAWHGASLIGGDTWQIEWTETVRSRAGKIIIEPTTYTATVITSLATPTDEDTMTRNPFGIYVKQFSWNQRIN